jgi:hypothetical protein
MRLDLIVLAAMTLVAAVSMRRARTLPRGEGALFVLAYVGFLVALLFGG